jgi:hypothetical protein
MKIALRLLVLIALVFSASGEALAQLPARQIADQRLSLLWPDLLDAQIKHHTAHGKYFQGLRTHSAIPEDGQNSAPDRLSSHPTDQSTSWSDFLTVSPSELPMSLGINVYSGHYGEGFVVIMDVVESGAHYRKAVAAGREFWQSHDWEIVK